MRPPENNCRPGFLDKQYKIIQQSLLHALRLQGYGYVLNDAGTVEESLQAYQMLLKHLCDLYWKINSWRKETSMPGSVDKAPEDHLFSRQDVQAAVLNSKIRTFRS